MASPDPPAAKPPAAFMRAASDLQGWLRGYIVSLVLDRNATDDLLPQTNIVLCEEAAEFEPGTNFKAWAFRVAFLEEMKHRRNAGRDRLVFDESSSSGSKRQSTRRTVTTRCDGSDSEAACSGFGNRSAA